MPAWLALPIALQVLAALVAAHPGHHAVYPAHQKRDSCGAVSSSSSTAAASSTSVSSTTIITSSTSTTKASTSSTSTTTSAQTSTSSSTSGSTLGALAAAAGKEYFGTEISSYYMANTQFSSITNTQFTQLTPENEMKWDTIHPSQNTYNWTGTDLIMATAQAHNQKFRGHNFCWSSQTPSWVTSITDATTLKSVLEAHITAVMGRYGGSMYAMDVVNEPLLDDGTWRSSVWYNVLGEDYIALALQYAHAAAPDVKLYINDYNLEGVNAKSKALLAIAKKLLAAGAPLHGIGFEAHFIGGSVPTDLAASMAQFTDLGLQVAITELDVRIPVDSSGVATAANLAQQAKDYAYVTNVCLANSLCPGITVWGFYDPDSWVPSTFAGYGAADLYDSTFTAKPALASTLAALAAA